MKKQFLNFILFSENMVMLDTRFIFSLPYLKKETLPFHFVFPITYIDIHFYALQICEIYSFDFI